MFVHEEFHFNKHIKGFKWGYNLLFGFLHKLPTYSYTPHKHHHATETYGTIKDPEYDLVVNRPAFTLLIPLVTMAFMSMFAFIRYGIIPAFLPFIGEKGRNWVYQNISTLVMNLKYHRPLPAKKERREWYIQDAICFIYNGTFIGLMAVGILPWDLLIVWFLTIYGVYVLNFYRVLTSHTYLTNFQKTSKKQQVLDSGTLPSVLFSGFLFPVGQRYHALHHMYPNVPYHNLKKVHNWLMTALPENHPYRNTISPNYPSAIKRLVSKTI